MTDEERLRQYQELLNSGVITKDEYNDMTKHLQARVQQHAEFDAQVVPEAKEEVKQDTSQSAVDDAQMSSESSIDEQAEAPKEVEKVIDERKKPIILMPSQTTKEAVPTTLDEQPSRVTRMANEADQVSPKGPKKNSDLLIAIIIVLVVLIGGGVVVTHHNQKNAQIGTENVKKETSKKAAASSSVKKNASENAEKKKASSEKKKAEEKVPAQWSDAQNKELADYMGIWQTAVGQDFVGTYNGGTPKHLAYKFPDALKDGQLKDHLKLDDHKVAFTWSPKADKKADYQVVAVATGSRQGVDSPTSYFFVIHEGQGQVYATETASGKDLTLTETQNADLKNNFASIVAETQNAASESQSDETPQEDVTISDDATVTEY
ncbi:DUF4767 domain-containing protein [Weissella hellenica]|nr:DUF4767 domain-containing protein [Weissella hellenica]